MPHVQHREIQGLRAVAVLLVVLFHLWPGRVPGGYVGVDVFFVISGYLITSLLLREVDRSGTVRLREFWARRMRRLLPAAFLVLAVSALGVLALEPRLVWPQFFREILAAGLYVENWVLRHRLGELPGRGEHPVAGAALLDALGGGAVLRRLAAARAARPLVVLPPPGGRGRILAVLAVAVGASLAYSLWITVHDPSAAYFVTPARAWEFGAGALLAFAPVARGRARSASPWAGSASSCWSAARSSSTRTPRCPAPRRSSWWSPRPP